MKKWVAGQGQDPWQEQVPELLPRREGGRAHVRRASRPRRQARELSPPRGHGAGGEGAEGPVIATKRELPVQVCRSDLEQAE